MLVKEETVFEEREVKVSCRSMMVMSGLVLSGAAAAQDTWPSRPIRFLVPWPAASA